LLQGLDSISEIPGERWPLEGFFQADADACANGLSYAKWGGFLKDIERFDAQFCGIPPREAACLDPQERLFLRCAWHARENSGHLDERSRVLRHANDSLDIDVFVGITSNTWPLLRAALWHARQMAIPSGLPWWVANRVSWALDLCGPSLAIRTLLKHEPKQILLLGTGAQARHHIQAINALYPQCKLWVRGIDAQATADFWLLRTLGGA
jgi:polyketide synthase PksL